MPLFDFECENCGHIEEILLKTSEAGVHTLTCVCCNGSMKKIFTPVCAVHVFKEQMFYAGDEGVMVRRRSDVQSALDKQNDSDFADRCGKTVVM